MLFILALDTKNQSQGFLDDQFTGESNAEVLVKITENSLTLLLRSRTID